MRYETSGARLLAASSNVSVGEAYALPVCSGEMTMNPWLANASISSND
jgi:hypothetical protein